MSASGFDVIVVTVSSEGSRRWWVERLGVNGAVGAARIAVVVESWAAGTAGGTILALRAGGEALGIDLFEPSERASLVVHAAGQGTRLEPLTSIEGEKPRVRLPGLVRIGEQEVAITLLEAVIRQMGAWAPACRGRIAVAWGDQLFAPVPPKRPTWVAAELVVRGLPRADDATWRAHDLHRYGVVTLDGEVAHVEKADRATFVAAIGREPVRVGLSLGVFSADPRLLAALAEVCGPRIEAGARLDTDRHWWMPLSLSADGYALACVAAGIAEEEARAWHARVAPIRDRFGDVLGAADLGEGAGWWDFGTLASWERNVRRVTEDGAEAEALRALLGCERLPIGHPLDPDGGSVLVASRVGGGRLRRSVVIGCDLDEADLTDAIRVGTRGTDAGTGLTYRSPDGPIGVF